MSATPGSDPSNGTRREPEDLKREADAIRADMDRTLSALERKLSPRQMLDRSLDFVQANGGQALNKLGAAVNKNPLPLLLTSAGLIWLIASNRSSRRSSHDSMSSRRGDFDRGTQSFSSSMQSRASHTASGLRARAHRTLEATRSRAGQTWSATRDRTHELGENMNGLIREQPLVCGAIALAIGAIIGAAFPATAYERNLVSRARDAGSDLLDEMGGNGQRDPLAGSMETPPTSH